MSNITWVTDNWESNELGLWSHTCYALNWLKVLCFKLKIIKFKYWFLLLMMFFLYLNIKLLMLSVESSQHQYNYFRNQSFVYRIYYIHLRNKIWKIMSKCLFVYHLACMLAVLALASWFQSWPVVLWKWWQFCYDLLKISCLFGFVLGSKSGTINQCSNRRSTTALHLASLHCSPFGSTLYNWVHLLLLLYAMCGSCPLTSLSDTCADNICSVRCRKRLSHWSHIYC